MQLQTGSKYLWRLPSVDVELVWQCAQTCNLPLPLAQALVMRGFDTPAQMRAFLFSSFEQDVPHPTLMKDADKAVERLMFAIKQQEKILIAGDYDVDGITATALLMLCLQRLGARINFFLPNRARDGYGLSEKTVARAAQNGYKLIITVDNGITAFTPAELAKRLGVDLIITDHHRAHDHLPVALAIIDPNQTDCLYPYKYLAGVGVSFKIMSLLYEKLGQQLPAKVYELLLLGTVADVVPLVGENRFWVRECLQYINNHTDSFSLQILRRNSKCLKPNLTSTDVGFLLAPQINALGRLEDPRDGVQFLIGSDAQEITRIGRALYELNQARKEIERTILDEVVQKIESGAIDLTRENVIVAASADWPTGVIGLVASRLVSKYGRPTLLFHLTADGLAKGSCRSIAAFSIFDALVASKELLIQFGGHSQAAGLSLKIEHLTTLKQQLETLIAAQLTTDDLQPKLDLDAELHLPDLNRNFMRGLAHLEPFGHHNHCPVFYIKDVVQIQPPVLLKDLHVKCQVFAEGMIKPLIFFNRPELYDQFQAANPDQSFALAAQVSENHWAGRVNIELTGVDVAFGEKK